MLVAEARYVYIMACFLKLLLQVIKHILYRSPDLELKPLRLITFVYLRINDVFAKVHPSRLFGTCNLPAGLTGNSSIRSLRPRGCCSVPERLPLRLGSQRLGNLCQSLLRHHSRRYAPVRRLQHGDDPCPSRGNRVHHHGVCVQDLGL